MLTRTQDDLSEQLRVQRAAFQRDSFPSLNKRLDRLKRVDALLRSYRTAFEDAICQDFGNRSRLETSFFEFFPGVASVKYATRNLKRWMKPESRSVGMNFWPGRARVEYQPLGVVGIVSPWNYPLLLAISPLVDALSAGNAAMIKPSEYTPAFSSLLKEAIAQVFSPEEVTVVLGGPDVADAFVRLPFDHLLFTGSTAIGRKVMAAAANNLTPVTLELGGKSPAIVTPGASLKDAAASITFGKFINGGQTCIAPDYVLAPADQIEEIGHAIMSEVQRIYPTIAGNPDYASLIHSRFFDRLSAAVDEAKTAGSRILTHRDTAQDGRKMAPTVVLDPPPGSFLLTEEIFGPVLPIVPYDSLDQAIAYVQDGARPLALYCFGQRRADINRVIRGTISGGVTVNGTLLHCAEERLPFGGVGASGMGAYHGFAGFQRFSHQRSIFEGRFFNAIEKVGPPFGKWSDRIVNFMARP
jgi:coniferyl-aldehyde dehydrogenase